MKDKDDMIKFFTESILLEIKKGLKEGQRDSQHIFEQCFKQGSGAYSISKAKFMIKTFQIFAEMMEKQLIQDAPDKEMGNKMMKIINDHIDSLLSDDNFTAVLIKNDKEQQG